MKDKEHLEFYGKKYIWYPFTQMQKYMEENPLIIQEGEGSYLKDINGNTYIDGISSLWVNIHGHRIKEIDEAIISQVGKIAHSTLLGMSNVPAIRLAKKLVEITPKGLDRVFYSDTGAVGVEIALKIAFQYWQQRDYLEKSTFISLKNGYHGDTLGAVSVGGIDLFHEIYKPLLFPSIKVKSPYCYRCPWGRSWPECNKECFTELEKVLKENHKKVCAFILEPLIQGAGGMIVFPSGYTKKARELCTKYNILMIADEVATGWGRTGRMFACEHEDVLPDIMVLSKGMTGGYLPLAATLTSQKIFDSFLGKSDENKTFYHGHTYTGNPLACAAAMANIELFDKHKTLERLQEKVVLLKAKLEPFFALPHVGDVRQRGFMVGIELVKDKETKAPFPRKYGVGHRVILEARERGLIIRPLADIIVLMPPLTISFKDLEKLLDITYNSMKSIT